MERPLISLRPGDWFHRHQLQPHSSVSAMLNVTRLKIPVAIYRNIWETWRSEAAWQSRGDFKSRNHFCVLISVLSAWFLLYLVLECGHSCSSAHQMYSVNRSSLLNLGMTPSLFVLFFFYLKVFSRTFVSFYIFWWFLHFFCLCLQHQFGLNHGWSCSFKDALCELLRERTCHGRVLSNPAGVAWVDKLSGGWRCRCRVEGLFY